MPRASSIAVLACVGLLGAGACSDAEQAAPSNGLLARLQDGGLTIVIRHATTDRSDPDDPEVDLGDCSTQRNLSDAGRDEAEAIGDAVDSLDIPVGSVWASPYCRSKDTAELAFADAEVVEGLEQLYPERDEQADQLLSERIGEGAPQSGEPNLFIVSHGVYPSVLSPAAAITEGEAAVYARDGDGFDLIGRLDPHEWAGLGSNATDLDTVPEGVADSVVSVSGAEGNGTAFRVALPGILVTNARVAGDADEVTVQLPNGDKRSARVLGSDPGVDTAALRIDDDSALPAMHSGSSLEATREGDRVYAVGADNNVTASTIDDLSTTVDLLGAALDVIWIDDSTPAATAGGPLVNDDGYVLGVLTTSDDGDTVAVQVDAARDAVFEIVENSSTCRW